MKLQRLIMTLMPKGWIGWLILLVAALSLATVLPAKLRNPQALVLLLALGVGMVGGIIALPIRAFDLWDRVPWLIRGALLAIPAYLVVVTIGAVEELYNYRLWHEFLVPGRFAPWTASNSAGLLLGLALVASQAYRISQLPADTEQIVRGPRLMSHEEAMEQAKHLVGQSARPIVRLEPVDHSRN